MHNYTISDRVRTGLRISAPDDDVRWHLRLGGGEPGREEVCIPVDRTLDHYLDTLDADLRAAARGRAQASFPGVDPRRAQAACQEVFEGWYLDELGLGDQLLMHAGKHSPKGGPCLVHLAVPSSDGKLELEAGSYTERLIHGHIQRVYHDIAETIGLTPLFGGEGPNGTPEHLFRMERGCSFRVRRSSGPWREALVLWTGQELKLLPSRRPERRNWHRETTSSLVQLSV